MQSRRGRQHGGRAKTLGLPRAFSCVESERFYCPPLGSTIDGTSKPASSRSRALIMGLHVVRMIVAAEHEGLELITAHQRRHCCHLWDKTATITYSCQQTTGSCMIHENTYSIQSRQVSRSASATTRTSPSATKVGGSHSGACSICDDMHIG